MLIMIFLLLDGKRIKLWRLYVSHTRPNESRLLCDFDKKCQAPQKSSLAIAETGFTCARHGNGTIKVGSRGRDVFEPVSPGLSILGHCQKHTIPFSAIREWNKGRLSWSHARQRKFRSKLFPRSCYPRPEEKPHEKVDARLPGTNISILKGAGESCRVSMSVNSSRDFA
jgi:hypothetical protein